MQKNLPPVMGYRVHDVLSQKEGAPSNTVISRLILATNDDACIRDPQKAHITEGLHCLQRISDSTDIVSRSEFFAKLEIFIAMLNSYRLDCSRCLNDKCTYRDPECPITEVHDRNGHHPIGHRPAGKPDKKK